MFKKYPWTNLKNRIHCTFMDSVKPHLKEYTPRKNDDKYSWVAFTLKDWSIYRKQAKLYHPYRYFVFELIRKTESFIEDVDYSLRKPFYYVKNRFITKTHCLTSTLKKGQRHAYNSRIFYCLMNTIVEYIEDGYEFKTFKEYQQNGRLNEMPEMQVKYNKVVEEVYDWYKIMLPKLEKEIVDITNTLTYEKRSLEDMFEHAKEESQKNKPILDLINEKENQLEKTKKKMLYKIISVYDQLYM